VGLRGGNKNFRSLDPEVSTLISDTPISTPNGSAETSLTGGSPVGGQQGEQLMLQYHPAVVVMVL
jgi:hypothetical protein